MLGELYQLNDQKQISINNLIVEKVDRSYVLNY